MSRASNPMATEATAMAHGDLEAVEETSNSPLSNTRCCFCFPCFNTSGQSSAVGIAWWQRIGTGTAQIQYHSHWWTPAAAAFQKIREWSEIVAGPRWKTFIRRFNRNRGNNNANSHHHHHGKFQYDPLSYSLNFEEDANFDDDDNFNGFRNFSSRYASSRFATAAAAAAAAASVDTRGKDVAVIA